MAEFNRLWNLIAAQHNWNVVTTVEGPPDPNKTYPAYNAGAVNHLCVNMSQAGYACTLPYGHSDAEHVAHLCNTFGGYDVAWVWPNTNQQANAVPPSIPPPWATPQKAIVPQSPPQSAPPPVVSVSKPEPKKKEYYEEVTEWDLLPDWDE